VATKLSNFDESYWSQEASIQMYHDSMKELQVYYIDYYLQHIVGGGGMENCSKRFLDRDIAHQIMEEDTIPCNNCQYCMPCPYGIDIPGIFLHYNKWVVEKKLPDDKGDPDYRKNRRNYLISLDRSIPRDRQPDHCIQCGRCIHQKHCPQKINIPKELERVAQLVEQLKRDNT
jgi:hypothetical protein